MRNTKAGGDIEKHVKEGTVEKYLPEIKKEWKKRFNETICKEVEERGAKRC